MSAAGISQLVKCALGYSADGDYRRAEVCLRKALRLSGRRAGDFSNSRPSLWNELGIVCKYSGKLRSAERYYRLALGHASRLPDTPERNFFLANLYHNLGGLEHARGRFKRAEALARKGLQLRLKCSAPRSLPVASDMAALAAILDGLGEYRESEKLSHHALRTYRREYACTHPEIAVVLNNLGALYQAMNRWKRADSFYRAALKMKRQTLPKSHPDIAITMNNLAMSCALQGRYRLARLWIRKALQLLESSLGKSHPTTRQVRTNQLRIESQQVNGDTSLLSLSNVL